MRVAKRSNHQISVGGGDAELVLRVNILGAERFEHFTRYRRDRLLGELLGIERFGSPDTSEAIVFAFRLSRTDRGERAIDAI